MKQRKDEDKIIIKEKKKKITNHTQTKTELTEIVFDRQHLSAPYCVKEKTLRL